MMSRSNVHLSKAGLGHGFSQLVGQLVDRQLLGHRQCLGDCLDDVVVAVSDGHVLVDVGRVEDVRPGGGDGDCEGVPRHLCGETHLGQQTAHLLRLDVNSDVGVDLAGRHTLRPVAQLGVGESLAAGQDGLHGLHGEGRVAVLAEHGDQRVQHDAGLRQVRGGHLEEDVLGV